MIFSSIWTNTYTMVAHQAATALETMDAKGWREARDHLRVMLDTEPDPQTRALAEAFYMERFVAARNAQRRVA